MFCNIWHKWNLSVRLKKPLKLWFAASSTFFNCFFLHLIDFEFGKKLFQERAEQSRTVQSRAEQSRAEQSRAEQSRAEQSRAEQSRAEQSRTEQN
jgi:hypothetical protein